MSKGKQLAVNTLIVGLGKASSALAMFLVLPFYTKYLTSEEYGFIDLVIVYSSLVAPLATLRLELALFRWLIDIRGKKEDISRVVSSVMFMVCIGVSLYSVLFFILFSFINIDSPWLTYLYIVATIFQGIIMQAARGMGRVRDFAIAGIVNGVLSSLIGGILVVFTSLGVAGALIGMLVGAGTSAVFLLLKARLLQYMLRKPDMQLVREMLGFSAPMIPNGLSGWAVLAGSKVVVANSLGVAANGIYAVAGKFTSLFSGFYEVFNLTWTESAALHIKSKDRDEFFSKVFNAAITFFGSANICLLAVLPLVFSMLVDKSFKDAYYYIPVLMIGFLFDVTVRMIGAIYVALKLTKQVMYTTVFAAAVSIAGTSLLIGRIGLWSTAISACAAYISLSIYRYIDINRRGVRLVVNVKTLVLLSIGLVASLIFYCVRMDNVGLHVAAVLVLIPYCMYMNRDIALLLKYFRKSK